MRAGHGWAIVATASVLLLGCTPAATGGPCRRGSPARGAVLTVPLEPASGVATYTGKCWAHIAATPITLATTGTAPKTVTGGFKAAWSANGLYVLAEVRQWPLYTGAGVPAEQKNPAHNDTVEFYVHRTDSLAYAHALVVWNGVAVTSGAGDLPTVHVTASVLAGHGYDAELMVTWPDLLVRHAAAGQRYPLVVAYDIVNGQGTAVAKMEWANGPLADASINAQWGTIVLK